jgi:hypothetical protein
MNTIRIVVSAPGQIDAAALNEELKAALGKMPLASHNAQEAIVDCDPSEEATVRSVIEAHVANTAKREHNAGIDKQIAALEARVTPRRMREAVTGPGKVWLDDLDDQIAVLRAQRQ